MQDEVMKELDDIANHLEELRTLWKELVDVNGGSIVYISKCVVDFPCVQHTTLTTSFDDVVNGTCSLSHPYKNTLYMRKSYEKQAYPFLFEAHEIYRR